MANGVRRGIVISRLKQFIAIVLSLASFGLSADTRCTESGALETFLSVHEKFRANLVNVKDKDKDIDFDSIKNNSSLELSDQIIEMSHYHSAIKKITSYRSRCRSTYMLLDFIIVDENEALTRFSVTMKQKDGKWLYVFSEKIPAKIAKWFDDKYQSISEYVHLDT
jgi:hypothetical protein